MKQKSGIALGLVSLGFVGLAAIFNNLDGNVGIEVMMKFFAFTMSLGGGLFGLVGGLLGRGTFGRLLSAAGAVLGVLVFLSVLDRIG